MARSSIENLKPGSKVHLMGICGTAMASLAGLLQELGYVVSGSDLNPYPPMSTQLASLGIEVKKGYLAENLHPKPDFVIVGNVISLKNNLEAQELNKLNLPFSSLPQALGELLLKNQDTLVVAGTHGKTTTTSLLAWVLSQTQSKAPGFLIGGIPKNFARSFQIPMGSFFAIEGDEYDTAYFDKVPKFIHYHPKHAILTSVEFDHADIYKDLGEVQKAFVRLLDVLHRPGNETGTLIYCSDDRHTRELVRNRPNPYFFSYGLRRDFNPNFWASDLQVTEKGTSFQVQLLSDRDKKIALGHFLMPLSGDYNVNNALAVIALSYKLGFDLKKVAAALESFKGVKRRQDVLGEPNGIVVIEDFAHHPTAVRETLTGIQKKYPGRRFFAVFEPRSATSRRKIFQKDYVDAFQSATDVIIKTAYDQTKIAEDDRFSTSELVRDINQREGKFGTAAVEFSTVDEIISYLKTNAKSGDGILLMSNGGFDGIYEKLLKELGENKAK